MDLPFGTDDLIRRALAEDLGRDGDITSRATVPRDVRALGRCVARAPGVIAGLAVFARTFAIFDEAVTVNIVGRDGEAVETGAVLAEVEGPARSILTAERVALNLLQHMSGVATLTRSFVQACQGTGSRVLCTRKTIPGLRALERQAVLAGGGRLHRGGLDDGILIKRNHLRIAGGVEEAVHRAKAAAPHTLRVEVEVETLEELEAALLAGADAILLDNADLDTIKRAAHLLAGRVPLEISGGVNLDTIADIAQAGDVLISIGRLTHSAPAMDIALEVRPE
jgi:nicotinate-nucleotide pyrophosphorylase (carboxylating)